MTNTTLTKEQQEELDELIKKTAEDLGIPESVVTDYIDETGDDDLDDIEEAYSGEFSDEEEFARGMASNLGFDDSGWPGNCIDWSQAASELMYDCFEIDGHFFRNL